MARVVITGYMIRHPVAGNVLAYFHYVLGLSRLGHDVVYVEESGWPYSCYDPEDGQWHEFPHTGLRVVRGLFRDYDVAAPVCYVNRETGQTDGMSREELPEALRGADLLLNLGGVCWLPEFRLCRRRALLDMDPFFTQVERFGARLLADYHRHFSYGVNIGKPGCTVPTCGVDWRPAVPPVVRDLWAPDSPPADAPLTTVANWSSYGGLTYQGEHYGQKDEEFLRLLDLPGRVCRRLELALSGGQDLRDRLRAAGWSVRDAGQEVSTDVPTYQAYIRSSWGEFSAAKHAYVRTRCGWFSDRTVCYLAAGLPAILQDTGFTDWLPAGRGVLAFATPDQAAECVRQVCADYEAHRVAARQIAARVFDSRVVLPWLLERALS